MALKRHHKIIIGSFSFLVIALIILLGFMMYSLYAQENIHYNSLNDKISQLQANAQTQINSISESLLQLQNTTQSSQQQIALLKASSGSDFSGIIQSSLPSVVTVRTPYAQGAGFIINQNGYIVTNAHVLADNNGNLSQTIQVITNNKDLINAQFIGYNGTLDIALLKIPGQYSALTLGNSDSVQVGDNVVAIGDPDGLQFSVSEGIISAINRPGPNSLDYYFQTDAPLNPGNSGGPLIDKQGQVVGINNFKIVNSENLGFALESNYIKQTVNQIAEQNLNQTLV